MLWNALAKSRLLKSLTNLAKFILLSGCQDCKIKPAGGRKRSKCQGKLPLQKLKWQQQGAPNLLMLWAGCQFCSSLIRQLCLTRFGRLASGLCGQLQLKPISNTGPPRLSLRLPLAAARRARQQCSFLLCFPNTAYVSQCTENISKPNGENTELWQDTSLTRVQKSNFPPLPHPALSWKDIPKASPGCLWETQS